jgi:xanthine dehydrogenase accessory factor
MDLFEEIGKNRLSKQKAALCTIVQTKGSTPRKVGTKMMVFANGSICGTIGGGNLEKKVIQNALSQIEVNKSKLFKHDLLHQHNMCCGGSVEVFIEPIKKMNKLYIFGAGHTGKALAQHASNMDFDIYVFDDREEYINDINIENVNTLLVEHGKILPSLSFDENTYVVIMTYEHGYDRDILSHCINQPHSYLGMIGSKRKVELTKKMFSEGKIASADALDKVDMPMGFNIHAESPDEIAISILAKLIERKNG